MDSCRYDSVPQWFLKKWNPSVYENMRTHFHSTVPSLTSMYTGLAPQWHGILDHNQFYKFPLQSRTMFQNLADANVKCAYLTDEYIITKAQIFRGVQKLESTQAVIDFLNVNENACVTIHAMIKSHIPYEDTQVEEILNNKRQMAWLDEEFLKMAREAQRKQIDYYYKICSAIIEKTGAHAIVSADHGEAFGECHLFGHGELLVEEVLHVPYLVIDYRDPPIMVQGIHYLSETYFIVLTWFGLKPMAQPSKKRVYRTFRVSPAELEFPGGVSKDTEKEGAFTRDW